MKDNAWHSCYPFPGTGSLRAVLRIFTNCVSTQLHCAGQKANSGSSSIAVSWRNFGERIETYKKAQPLLKEGDDGMENTGTSNYDSLRAEQASFERKFDDWLKKYAGKYVAVHKGEVRDSDENYSALVDRVNSDFGDKPVLIRKVVRKSQPDLGFRAPYRIQRPSP